VPQTIVLVAPEAQADFLPPSPLAEKTTDRED